jgi:hypothetical protein
MSSLREQILATMKTVLTAAAPGGATVFRSRETSITRAVVPALVIMPADNALSRMATNADKNQFEVDIEIFTRGDPWDSLADPIDIAAHTTLMTNATLQALITDIRRISETFEGQEADKTAGTLTVRYRITFLTRATDIAVAA